MIAQLHSSSPFGPFYPQGLQIAVNHAEAFAEVLGRAEEEDAEADLALWLTGRNHEVALVVEIIISDWKAARLGTHDAAMAIERYLREMHEELAVQSGQPPPLACCTSEAHVTSQPHAACTVIRRVQTLPPPCSPQAAKIATVMEPVDTLQALDRIFGQ